MTRSKALSPSIKKGAARSKSKEHAGRLTRLLVLGYKYNTKRPLRLCVHPLSEQLMLGAHPAHERCGPWSLVDCLQCVLVKEVARGFGVKASTVCRT